MPATDSRSERCEHWLRTTGRALSQEEGFAMSTALIHFLLVAFTAALVLAGGADQAWAVTVDGYPTWPIPSDASVVQQWMPE
jgi:hypothetical protein